MRSLANAITGLFLAMLVFTICLIGGSPLVGLLAGFVVYNAYTGFMRGWQAPSAPSQRRVAAPQARPALYAVPDPPHKR